MRLAHLPATALTLLLNATLPVQAAIAPGNTQSGSSAAYNGNGELFLSVFDGTAKVSYTLDLGVTQNDFFAAGQVDAGMQRFWALTDDNWTAFVGQVNTSALRWSVLGIDQTGGTAVGGVRLFTTVRQGDEDKIIDVALIDPLLTTGLSTLNNQLFSVALGSSQAGTFFSAVNGTGTHGAPSTAPDFTINGSSVNADSDSGNAYFGEGGVGLTPNLNGNAPFDVSNEVGKSSWFYYLTRSSTDQLEFALVDEFDNLTADGYFGFIYVDPTLYPDSIYAGQWLLSYTLEGTATTAALAQREFAASIGRTESNGGFRVTRLGAVAAATATETPAALWSRRLGGVDSAVTSPVPEPATVVLMLGGLALVGAAARRRA